MQCNATITDDPLVRSHDMNWEEAVDRLCAAVGRQETQRLYLALYGHSKRHHEVWVSEPEPQAPAGLPPLEASED